MATKGWTKVQFAPWSWFNSWLIALDSCVIVVLSLASCVPDINTLAPRAACRANKNTLSTHLLEAVNISMKFKICFVALIDSPSNLICATANGLAAPEAVSKMPRLEMRGGSV